MPGMSESPLMSIILPVYNAEATLEACLDSACAQDGVNLELVCIDDGSQDSSASLLEARAACDPRIRLFRQDNAGAAAARNRALGEIRGAFFTLLDADDRLEPGYLAALMQAALQQQADAVISGWTRLSKGSVTPHAITADLEPLPPGAPALAGLPPAAWGHLYSTALLQRSGARYPIGVRYGEDMAFNYAICAAATRLILHPSTGYLYIDTPTSASNNLMGAKVLDMTDALAYLAEAYNTQGMNPLRQELLAHFAAQALRRIRSMAPHRCQHDCARRVRDILLHAGVDDSRLHSLRHSDASSLRRILHGGDGLGPGYYWRRLTRFLRGKHRATGSSPATPAP